MAISRLESCGFNASDIKKLQEAGLHTVESVRAVQTAIRLMLRALFRLETPLPYRRLRSALRSNY